MPIYRAPVEDYRFLLNDVFEIGKLRDLPGFAELSPELVDYRLYDLPDLRCWPAGTGYGLADWLRTRGHEPQFMEWPRPAS